MKKCIITGASGLLGSYLVPLLSKEYEIYSLSRNKGIRQYNVNNIDIDLSKDWSIRKLPQSVDLVIHLAQKILVDHAAIRFHALTKSNAL